MSPKETGVRLVPLRCLRCNTPQQVEPGDQVWCCAECGQALMLLGQEGLQTTQVCFAQGRSDLPIKWLPFWVCQGFVKMRVRKSYSRDGAPHPRWKHPQRFVIPAFDSTIEQLIQLGEFFLQSEVVWQEGPRQALPRVGINLADLRTLIEVLVMKVEVDLRDRLERIDFELDLEKPTLWVLPIVEQKQTLALALAED